MTRYTSSDGLLSSSDPANVALWESIVADQAADQRRWNEALRAMGVKAAHPDDGWVHRESTPEQVHFEYPAFNDGPRVGDLIALGAPYHHGEFLRGKDRWQYRLGRVVKVEPTGVLIPMTYYHFEDTGVRLPPRPSRWQRLMSRWSK